MSNTATVTPDDELDPVPDNNSSQDADTELSSVADLSVQKSDGPDPVESGETLSYTITVDNPGPSTAESITITDSLPVSVIYRSAWPGWDCAESSGEVTCNRPSLEAGASSSITIDVTAPGIGLEITNYAER